MNMDIVMNKNVVIIVDPFSTGVLLAPALSKRNIKCYAVLSAADISVRFTSSYRGDGFADVTLYSADQIQNKVASESVLAVIAGAETGVYCAEQLAKFFSVAGNNHNTTAWRRNKSAMQERLAECGLKHIASKRITQIDTNIDQFNSTSGYVIKPDNSCLTDGVVFLNSKQQVEHWIASIDWDKSNVMGKKNDTYIVQEKIDGEEFVVDLLVKDGDVKICALCKYKKGLHNQSHFVYEALEVLDANSNDLKLNSILEYAKQAAITLGVVHGVAHLEIMNSANGPVLIELGARLHGGIAPLLFEKCYSPGLLASTINLILGNFSATTSHLQLKARILFLINEKTNFKIGDIEALEKALLQIEAVTHVKLFINADSELPLTTDLANCPGIISLIANSDMDLLIAEQQVRNIFNEAG